MATALRIDNDSADDSREDDFHHVSARRAAVKNRLGGDFIRRELRLQVSATLVEAGDI